MRSQITEAQKIAGGSGTEQDIAEAKVELEASSPSNCFFVSVENSYKILGIGGLARGAEVEISTSIRSQLYNNGSLNHHQQALSILYFRIFHRSCQS